MEKIDQQVDSFKTYIEQSYNILVTSHVGPDPDAICSALLLGVTLTEQFPDKKITICFEDAIPAQMDFLAGYKLAKAMPLIEALNTVKPQLLIMADGNNYLRFTRGNDVEIKEYIKNNNVKTVVIDHHLPNNRDEVDLFINRGSPAATQDIFWLLFEQLKYNKPNGYADLTMLGISSDTGRFAYKNNMYDETLRIVKELFDQGVVIEELENKAITYSVEQMHLIGHLAENLVSENGLTYSFMSDEYTKMWQEKNLSFMDLKAAIEPFSSTYIRSINGAKWGFIVYPDMAQEGYYAVSLRSVGSYKDVAVIARALGGGGHRPAAGCKIKANTVGEVIQIVLAEIQKHPG